MIGQRSMARAALSGCTYQANVAPTVAAAADIAPGRTVDKPVSYYVSPELASLTRNASEGYVCSANAFPVNAGPAIVSTSPRLATGGRAPQPRAWRRRRSAPLE
jgi:hypothetical protein